MIIKGEGIQITIADDSPTALKIKQGFDYNVVNGVIKVGKIYKEAKNKWQIIKEVEKANDVPGLKVLFIKMLDLIE